MYLANIKTADIGNALAKGYQMKAQKLRNSALEEKQKQGEAQTLEYGNYMAKNSPQSVVKPQDTDGNGVIDPEEEKEAKLSTGRKYNAFSKIRSDTERSQSRKQVMAYRAAAEGRAQRGAQMREARFRDYNEKVAMQKEQDEKDYQNTVKMAVENGYTPEQAEMIGQVAKKDKRVKEELLHQMPFKEKIDFKVSTEAGLKTMFTIAQQYSATRGDGKDAAKDQEANAQAIKATNEVVGGLDQAQKSFIAKGDKKNAALTQQNIDRTKKMVKDGKFDYKEYEKSSAALYDDYQRVGLALEGGEVEAEKKHLFDRKEKGYAPTSLQKDTVKYDETISTPEGKRSAGDKAYLKAYEKKYKTKEKKAKPINAAKMRAEVQSVFEGQYENEGMAVARNIEAKYPGHTVDWYAREAKKAIVKKTGVKF